MKKNEEIWQIKGLSEMITQLVDVQVELKKLSNKKIAGHSKIVYKFIFSRIKFKKLFF